MAVTKAIMAGSGIVPGTGKSALRLHSLAGFLTTALVISAFYYLSGGGDSSGPMVEDETPRRNSFPGCNLFSGKWVYDNNSYPLYKEGQCSFMADDFACEKFGRKENKYQHWRWQPHDCDLPRSLTLSGTVKYYLAMFLDFN